jgi:cell division septum initiation protein DivIVA
VTLAAALDELRAQLAAAGERETRLAAQLATAEAQAAELLAHERERADKAIAALGKLADEIAKLAEQRSRPWWRRLVG